MRKYSAKIFITIAIMMMLCTLAGCGASSPSMPLSTSSSLSQTQESDKSLIKEKLMESIYYDREIFYRSVNFPEKYEIDGQLIGGMIPHHLVAGDMIAGFFELATKQAVQYDTVLIVAPSHYPENCTSDVLTTTADWNTPFGIVKNDTEISERLINNKLIAPQNSAENVEFDHAIGGLVPFIKHYLPDAKLAVCLVSNKVFDERLEEIWDTLANEAMGDENKNVLLLASVDCSHYLMPNEAEVKDKETIGAIAEFDYQKLLKFSDKNIDSPQSVTTMLKAGEKQNAKLSLLGHSSSEVKLPHSMDNPIYDEGVTTYQTYALTVPKAKQESPVISTDKSYVKKLAQDIISDITTPTMNELQKVKSAYDYIIKNTYFADPIGLDSWQLHGDTTPPDYIEQRALSVLAYGIGSCEDYAAAMVVLLKEMGFESMYVPGLTLSIDNEYVDHAWTAVKLSDGWYHIDSQLEDNVTKGTLSYRFFLKGDSDMVQHHIWGERLIEYAEDLTYPQKQEIRESYIIPPCPRSYPQESPIEMDENPPKDTRKILDELNRQRMEYTQPNGKLPIVELNITPPVFGNKGYGTPD